MYFCTRIFTNVTYNFLFVYIYKINIEHEENNIFM